MSWTNLAVPLVILMSKVVWTAYLVLATSVKLSFVTGWWTNKCHWSVVWTNTRWPQRRNTCFLSCESIIRLLLMMLVTSMVVNIIVVSSVIILSMRTSRTWMRARLKIWVAFTSDLSQTCIQRIFAVLCYVFVYQTFVWWIFKFVKSPLKSCVFQSFIFFVTPPFRINNWIQRIGACTSFFISCTELSMRILNLVSRHWATISLSIPLFCI